MVMSSAAGKLELVEELIVSEWKGFKVKKSPIRQRIEKNQKRWFGRKNMYLIDGKVIKQMTINYINLNPNNPLGKPSLKEFCQQELNKLILIHFKVKFNKLVEK